LPFPNSDFDYNDESFVFTNVSANTGVSTPEPATLASLVIGVAGALGWMVHRRLRA
jgi:hypothetical protein